MGKYGLPYMGSKSAIADRIIDVLPPGERFIDLFGGGGAMTHAAALSGKYNEVVYSDADPLACEYITRAIRGDFDFSAFLGWAARIPCYISPYELDDSRFRIYHEFKKRQLLCATKHCTVIERLYASRYAAKEKI